MSLWQRQYGGINKKSILNIIKSLEVELDVPIALMGDFNVNVNDKTELAEFLAKEFGLVHHANVLPTALGGTSIDHVFLRKINTQCMPYISYFSYHRPLLNKLLALL
jgi:endonuclease/exonuclease/phosphatase (EEP) superfamily protein YafD